MQFRALSPNRKGFRLWLMSAFLCIILLGIMFGLTLPLESAAALSAPVEVLDTDELGSAESADLDELADSPAQLATRRFVPTRLGVRPTSARIGVVATQIERKENATSTAFARKLRATSTALVLKARRTAAARRR